MGQAGAGAGATYLGEGTQQRPMGLRVSSRHPRQPGSDHPGPPPTPSQWAYARPYATNADRTAAYAPWLHAYNHHRPHTALSGKPPASRVTNLSGQYI